MAQRPFIHDDFMLETDAARTLFHEYAKGMPIIDYHCHLPPVEVAEDKRWSNIAQAWLSGDHYKWRAMRSNGVEERFCTGDAPDREKFQKFAETMPYLLRNPMYHWSHLELARYFKMPDVLLGPDTARRVWDRTAERLRDADMSARGLMRQSNVRLVCTTDDPTDRLEHHHAVAADASFDIQMLPTWRPDKALAIDRLEFWNGWVDKLERVADVSIATFDQFLTALQRRHDAFAAVGCRLSDYGLETVYAESYTDADVAAAFARARAGDALSPQDVLRFRSAMLYQCGKMDAESDWTWQIHYNALRNNNLRLFPTLGPDAGFDSIGDWPIAQALSRLLGRLDAEDRLPRTILYTLNPRDNEVLAAMLGNFQRAPMPGKIQLGSGWWFNDQKDGMERQMEALSQLGLISRFVGMLTDSRSFLSYTRHEYFRRILCNVFGRDIEKGLVPRDFAWVGEIVRGICYNNAARYFGFKLPVV
jgi:glucuronate isomerase